MANAGSNPVGPGPGAVLDAAATEGDVAITGKASLILRRLLRNKGAVIGLVMLLVALLFSVLGNLPNKWQYDDQDLLNIGMPPSPDHWFGTNVGGVDLYAMIVRGTGKSLMIAAVVGVVAPIIAAIYGTAIAFWGGRREKAGMWLLDMLLLMPTFLLIAVFMGQFGGNALVLAVLLTLLGWMGMARVIRATTQSLREREFVQAARYMGVSDLQIIRRHIIPNIGSYLILQIVLGTFGAIILETALSFLGVGVRPPDVSLGMLIGQSSSQLSGYPWMFWAPTLALQWITVALALVGDGMRDALDPNSKSGGTA
ncbi:ABC transporter permease [Arsenicicoccus sp. oral taxon 190]|nr:ABC transporter permease [Arsenicicoccus sp. oral taxon 190]